MVRTQLAAPLQAPDHPVNDDPGAATAVSVTAVPYATSSLQSAPQSMPAGVEVTVPAPAPASATESATGCGSNRAVAESAFAALGGG